MKPSAEQDYRELITQTALEAGIPDIPVWFPYMLVLRLIVNPFLFCMAPLVY